MSTPAIAVDLAKNVFEIAVTGKAGSIRERKRLSRPQFEQFWTKGNPCLVVIGGLLELALLVSNGRAVGPPPGQSR